MSYLQQDQEHNDRIRCIALAPILLARDDDPHKDTRWTLAQCEQVMHHDGVAALRMWGVPLDYSGMRKLKDCVPYNAKKLEALTRKFCSASPEFAPRTKSNAAYRHQNLKQRLPTRFAGGALFTRQTPCVPFESGPNTLPGMEKFKV